MKRYIKSALGSYTSNRRNNYTRKMKKTNQRRELYDVQNDIIDAVDNALPSTVDISYNVFSRGPKGSKIDFFKDENKPNNIRFTKAYATKLAKIISDVVSGLGYEDRCEIIISDEDVEFVKEQAAQDFGYEPTHYNPNAGYTVIVNIALNPDIVD